MSRKTMKKKNPGTNGLISVNKSSSQAFQRHRLLKTIFLWSRWKINGGKLMDAGTGLNLVGGCLPSSIRVNRRGWWMGRAGLWDSHEWSHPFLAPSSPENQCTETPSILATCARSQIFVSINLKSCVNYIGLKVYIKIFLCKDIAMCV